MNMLKQLLATLLLTQAVCTISAADNPIKSCDRLPMSAYIWH